MIIKAECYFQDGYYNPNIRASIRPLWIVALREPLPGTNHAAEFCGTTREEAINNAISCFKEFGLTGRLRLN
jgi:hypothetical protein